VVLNLLLLLMLYNIGCVGLDSWCRTFVHMGCVLYLPSNERMDTTRIRRAWWFWPNFILASTCITVLSHCDCVFLKLTFTVRWDCFSRIPLQNELFSSIFSSPQKLQHYNKRNYILSRVKLNAALAQEHNKIRQFIASDGSLPPHFSTLLQLTCENTFISLIRFPTSLILADLLYPHSHFNNRHMRKPLFLWVTFPPV
jgi:hypothetical protein